MRLFKKKDKNEEPEKKHLSLKKKLLIGVATALVAIASTILPTKIPVFAAERAEKRYYGIYLEGHQEGIAWYNGQELYCTQRDSVMPGPYGTNGTTSPVYSVSSFESFGGLSYAQKRKVAALTYFGHGYGGRDDITWHYAAQTAIWEYLGEGGASWSGAASNADIQAKKATVIADADNYLNSSQSSVSAYINDENGKKIGDTYTDQAVVGKTYTITGDIANSKIVRNDFGDRAVKKGNTVTVTLNSSDFGQEKAITFEAPVKSLQARGSDIVLYAGSYQNLISIHTPSPYAVQGASGAQVSVTIKAKGVPVEFTKKDTSGNTIAGASLSLYKVNDGTSTLIETYITTTSSKHFDLAPGTYQMVEDDAPKGYYKSSPVTFTVEEKTSTQYFEMKDEPLQLKLGKFGASSGDTVVGAHLQIYSQKTNEVVDDFYTTDEDKILTSANYEAGGLYYVRELEAPSGYFTILDDVLIQVPLTKPADDQLENNYYKYRVTDEEVDYKVAKHDVRTGELIKGATMQVIDQNNDVIDEWVTDGTEHTLDKTKLTVGNSYRVHEKSAPKGYYVMAQDVSFSVSPGVRSTYVVDAYDYPISSGVLKTDEDGAPVAGALLAIYDGDTEIDRWTSTDQPHMISGLENGKTYTVKELSAPDGYYLFSTPKEITISAPSTTAQDKDNVITVADDTIDFYLQKIDSRTKQRLSGAQFEIIDEDGNVVATVESSDAEKVKIPNEVLKSGKTYTVHESISVDGYYYADGDKTFTVPSTVEDAKRMDKTAFTVTVEDKPIRYSVLKVDSKTGETVSGAQLALYENNDSDKPLYTWTSTDEPEVLSEHVALIAGHEYYIKEFDAPDGYYLSGDSAKIAVPYNTDQTGTIKVTFANTPIIWHIAKQDMDGNLLTKVNGSYFTLEVYDTNETLDNNDDDTLIATLRTDDKTYKANAYFDMESYIKQGLVKGGHHYRIHEASAANGYLVAEDKIQEIAPTGETDTILTAVQDEKITVHIKKVDEQGNLLTTYKLLDGSEEGFEITIYDEASGEKVCSFNTSDPSYIKNGYYDISDYLSTAKSYVARETSKPYGYFVAKDYSFTVDSATTLDDKTIVMVDPTLRAQFRKEDEVGNVLTSIDGEGFEFQIINDATNEVVGTINTKDADLSKGGWTDIGQYLQEATTYRIHEVYAPVGFDFQLNDAYITTPGYYVESDGTVQNVIISPNEYVTFTINGTSYTEFRAETVEEFARNHSDTFKIMTVNGEDILVKKMSETKVTFPDGKVLNADTVLADIEGTNFNA